MRRCAYLTRPKRVGEVRVNRKEQLWVEWFLGVFGTAALFITLALIGMAIQGTKMGWLSYVLGTLAFGIVPYLVIASRPYLLTGGIAGVGMAIGGMAILLIFASIYGVDIPPLAVVAGLFLGFLGGALGEPHLGTA
jgi:hypothetical protein